MLPGSLSRLGEGQGEGDQMRLPLVIDKTHHTAYARGAFATIIVDIPLKIPPGA
jgi:hypothetical protein